MAAPVHTREALEPMVSSPSLETSSLQVVAVVVIIKPVDWQEQAVEARVEMVEGLAELQ